MPNSQEHSPVFLIGNPRSGTTMFRLALTAHSCVSIPPENPFIISLFAKYGHVQNFNQEQLTTLMQDLRGEPVAIFSRWKKVPEATIQSLLDDSVGCSYAEICAKLYRAYPRPAGMNSMIWGDKNNSYYRYLEMLNWLFPNAKFIHLVRDGRAVLASYQALLKKQEDNERFPVLPADPVVAATRWSDAVRSTDAYLSSLAKDRYIKVRYEDVVTDFENQMRSVCALLGLEYEPDMENFHELNQKFELEPRDYDKWKWRTRQPITAKRVDAWRESLSTADVARFEAVAGRVLVSQNYQLENTSASFSFSDRIKWSKEAAVLSAKNIVRRGKFLYKKTAASKN